MDANAVREMIDEDRREWAKLTAMLDAHPEGPLHDPESPEWTARDVYTHIAHLMEGSVNQMQAKLAGQRVSNMYAGEDEDDVNTQVQQAHSALSFDEARAWAQRSFEGMIAAIEAVPLERWNSELEFYARADGAEHYRGHMSYIVAT